MTASRLRLVAAVVAGLAWAVTLPLAADALRAEGETWAAPRHEPRTHGASSPRG